MAPPNDPTNSMFRVLESDGKKNSFELCHGKLSVKGVALLSQVPSNVSFQSFSSICQSSDAPLPLFQSVRSRSYNGGFLGFNKEEPSDRLMNSLGKFNGRDFLSIYRFKTWWSTQWVGSCGSDLQMETQWVLLDVPEISSYVLILPTIEGKFRSALHPGTDGHLNIFAESGSTQVKASSFDAIAYVHVSENPYTIMKEAYTALRVHLNTFKLLEGKSAPPIVDKFGWGTWDAFYLSVEPAGVRHGVKEFTNGGVSPRFLIIDQGWQSTNLDTQDPHEDAKNLVLGGTQMTARLHSFEECVKFRSYKGGSLTGQIIQPDWDMFQLDHRCAKFHAGLRAICGGPVYVSDSLGRRDFNRLKKLVFPDGTIPKCHHFALPTSDCLFKDLLFNNKTILKIWNLNKYGGVIGAFNCQGVGWDSKEQRIKDYMSGSVHVTDIEWDQKLEATTMGEAEKYAVYLNQYKKLFLTTPNSHNIPIKLKPSSFEIFSFVPIKKLGLTTKFAPIGLTNMFNSGGTIQSLDYDYYYSKNATGVKIEVKGGGNFLAFSSGKPKKCFVNGSDVGFEWSVDGRLTLNLPWIEKAAGISELIFLF